MKVFIIIGMLCVSSVECMWFNEPEPVIYTDLDKCLEIGKNLGNEMFNRMNKIGVPSQINVWCKELNQHGEYS